MSMSWPPSPGTHEVPVTHPTTADSLPQQSSTAVSIPKCPYCGGTQGDGTVHAPEECYMVRAIEYHPNGAIKRIEFGNRLVQQPVIQQPLVPTVPPGNATIPYPPNISGCISPHCPNWQGGG